MLETLKDESAETVAAWQPFADSPQERAYYSEADELFYGGAAGGGKTDLLLGLAGTAHRNAVLFRREFPRMRAIIERSREIFNARGNTRSKGGYNESLHIWRLDDGRVIELAAMQYEKDKENYRGRPHDFYGFDEITEFTESQFRFVIGWNRSTVPGQRCRVVVTGNPPTSAEGEWVIQYWKPWLDPSYSNPAKPGELRWFVRMDDRDVEVESSEPFERNGELFTPRSRTFIPALLKDNPVLMATGYYAVINNMPEPLRTQMLKGDFTLSFEDDRYQVIPTAWVLDAQKRWETGVRPDLKPRAIGVDVARGGKDETTVATLYGTWFEIEGVPGRDTPNGDSVVELIAKYAERDTPISIDSIGVGSSAYDSAVKRFKKVNAFVAGASSTGLDTTGSYGFANLRSEAWWKMREALNPASGENIALPPSQKLRVDLTTPRFTTVGGKYKVESKDDIYKRIQRSTDYGDAVVECWYEATSGAIEAGMTDIYLSSI